MVDVSAKPATEREAVAAGRVVMQPETLDIVRKGDAKKGDVLGAARIAGIMAAKRTHDLIPLCHPLSITKAEVDIRPDAALPGLEVTARVKVAGKTGVEMEALTAVAVACLTIYDMVKAVDRGILRGSCRCSGSCIMLHPESHAFCSPNQTSSHPVPMPRWLGAAG